MAEGPPEAGMAVFSGAETTADLANLSWQMEEATRLFYLSLAGRAEGQTSAVFQSLAAAENAHKESLAAAYTRATGKAFREVGQGTALRHVLEGGVDLEEALAWTDARPVSQAMDFAMSLEVNSYDRYLKMARGMRDPSAHEVFRTLASEEREHLKKLEALAGR